MTFWRSPARVSDASGSCERRRPLIVVADDDRDTRELYRAFFDLSGFDTAEAANGQQALVMARRLVPDVLLTDLVLPDFDGLALTRMLKASPETAGVRVLLLTGYAYDGLERRALQSGVERALIKPCLPSAILREVTRALQRVATTARPNALPA